MKELDRDVQRRIISRKKIIGIIEYFLLVAHLYLKVQFVS